MIEKKGRTTFLGFVFDKALLTETYASLDYFIEIIITITDPINHYKLNGTTVVHIEKPYT